MSSMQWYKRRQQWRKVTTPTSQNTDKVYKPAQLTMQACEMIHEIIMSTKGPYPPFTKKINLADLASLVEEVWDEDD